MKIVPLVAAALLVAAPAPALAAQPAKPLPVQSCNGSLPGKNVHGDNRPCAPLAVAPVVAPVNPLAIVSITPAATGYSVRATDDKAVAYVSIHWRVSGTTKQASCLVQTPSSGTRVDGLYACTPATTSAWGGTYTLFAAYVADTEGNRRSYTTPEQVAPFANTFTR